MKIRTVIKPNSKKGPLIIKSSDGQGEFFEIYIREPAIEGRANKAAIELLSKELGIPKTKLLIKSGKKSRFKIFSLHDKI